MRRTVRPLLLCGMAALLGLAAGCGDTAPEAETPATATVTRIEVAPSALLLTGSGQTGKLQVRGFDAQGNEVKNARFAWLSSMPAEVAVADDGQVRAATAVGSALITVSAGTAVSPPVMVTTLQTQANTTLVADGQVGAAPAAVTNTDGTRGPNYTVELTGVAAPAVGSLLLSSGSHAVAGRVVATRAGLVPQTTLVTLQPVALNAIIKNAAISLRFSPEQLKAYAATATGLAAVDRSARMTRLAQRAGESHFGPFECDTSFDATRLTLEPKATVVNGLSFNADVRIEDSVVQSLILSAGGPITGTFSYAMRIGQVTGDLKCRSLLAAIPVPVTGWFRYFLEPVIPINAEIRAKLALPSLVAYTVTRSAELDVSMGVSYDRATGWADLNHVALKPGGTITTEQAGLNNGVKFTLFAGIGTGINMESGLLGVKESLIEITAGPQLTWEGALPQASAQTNGAKSEDRTDLTVSIAPGGDLKAFLKRVADDLEIKINLSAVLETPLSRSPAQGGFATASQGSFRVGDTVNFVVPLDPATVRDGGSYNVKEVRIYRLADNDTTGLGATEVLRIPAQGEQTEFRAAWVATANESLTTTTGQPRFYAYAVPVFLQPLRSVLPVKLTYLTGPPTITAAPASTTVLSSAPASFSVGATSEASLSYQWLRNGVAIAGATAPTLNLVTTAADNGALFSAVVTGAGVSSTSSAALLTVVDNAGNYGFASVSGNAQALGGSNFYPDTKKKPAVVQQGPTCVAFFCQSQLTVVFTGPAEGSFPQLIQRAISVTFLTYTEGNAGTAPGVAPTTVSVLYTVNRVGLNGQNTVGYSIQCGANIDACTTVATVGAQVDVATQTIRLDNVRVTAPDGSSATLNGMLRY